MFPALPPTHTHFFSPLPLYPPSSTVIAGRWSCMVYPDESQNVVDPMFPLKALPLYNYASSPSLKEPWESPFLVDTSPPLFHPTLGWGALSAATIALGTCTYGKNGSLRLQLLIDVVRVPVRRVIEFIGQKSARKADRVGMGGEEIGAREGGLLKWNGWAAEVRECALACGLWGIATTP